MTPVRAINYATWAIWASVTLVAVLNAGWVRISTIEAGGAFPMTLEFFVLPDYCFMNSDWLPSLTRHYVEIFMVPASLVLIGFALAVPWSRLRTATAAYTLLSVALTLVFAVEPRVICSVPIVKSHIISYPHIDVSHLVGITLFDVISLVPRVLYLALFLVTPVQWAPVGAWMRDGSNRRVNATQTS